MAAVVDDHTARMTGFDARSFGAFIREHDKQLRGVAWSVVRDQHRTDDIMQAAYEKAFRSLDSFDGRSSMSTWLHSIVYRTAIDHVRYDGRRRHDDLDVVIDISGSDFEAADAGVGRLELAAALDRLDPDERAALWLTAALGYSYDEAGATEADDGQDADPADPNDDSSVTETSTIPPADDDDASSEPSVATTAPSQGGTTTMSEEIAEGDQTVAGEADVVWILTGTSDVPARRSPGENGEVMGQYLPGFAPLVSTGGRVLSDGVEWIQMQGRQGVPDLGSARFLDRMSRFK